MAFELSSSAFSPPLAWTSPPAGAKRFALVCEDPDAPRGHWVHWVRWGIPATATSLGEAELTGRYGRS